MFEGLDVVAGQSRGAVWAGARPHVSQQEGHRRMRACMGQPEREPGEKIAPAPFRLQHGCAECLVTVVRVFLQDLLFSEDIYQPETET